jgi:hypothetical protein
MVLLVSAKIVNKVKGQRTERRLKVKGERIKVKSRFGRRRLKVKCVLRHGKLNHRGKPLAFYLYPYISIN